MQTTEVTQQVTSYFAPSSLAIVGALIRRLAYGTPITRIEAATLVGCTESNLDTHVAQLPFRMELDDEGRIVGAGLTLRPTPHEFVVDGKGLKHLVCYRHLHFCRAAWPDSAGNFSLCFDWTCSNSHRVSRGDTRRKSSRSRCFRRSAAREWQRRPPELLRTACMKCLTSHEKWLVHLARTTESLTELFSC